MRNERWSSKVSVNFAAHSAVKSATVSIQPRRWEIRRLFTPGRRRWRTQSI
jgi:hypothetical protein